MKKFVSLLIILITIISTPVQAYAQVPVQGLSHNDFRKIIKDSPIWLSPEMEKDTDQIKQFYDAWNKIPENLRTALINAGITVYLYSEQESRRYNNYSLGYSRDQSWRVYYDGRREKLSNTYSDIYCCNRRVDNTATMIHELGHCIDYEYNGGGVVTNLDYNITHRKDWIAICNEEKNAISQLGDLSKHNVYNTEECWAEVFCYMILDYKKVRETCPKSCNYCLERLKEFVGYYK